MTTDDGYSLHGVAGGSRDRGAEGLKRHCSCWLDPRARSARIELSRRKERARRADGRSGCSSRDCGGDRASSDGSADNLSFSVGLASSSPRGWGSHLVVAASARRSGRAVERAVCFELNELAERVGLAQGDACCLREARREGDAAAAPPAYTRAGPEFLLLSAQRRAAPAIRSEPELQIPAATREHVRR